WRCGRAVVVEPLGVGAAIALQLRLDPIERGAVARRPLAPVTKLREPLDRRLVALEFELGDERGDRIGGGGLLGEERRRCGESQHGDGGERGGGAHWRSRGRRETVPHRY